MPKKNQKPEKGHDLGKEILEAAKSLFLEQGYDAASMRKIAARVGISATAIYLYYQDKAAIIHALHQIGFELLESRFRTLATVENSFERLKAMGRTYINFALENPDFYEIMFVMKEPLKHLSQPDGKSITESCWAEGDAAFQALISNVEACQQEGYFRDYDPRRLALLVWSNIHGLCSLKNDGRLELLAQKTIGEVDIVREIQASFELYVKMLEQI